MKYTIELDANGKKETQTITINERKWELKS
mgnify:CR=1 FL=1